jgi:hypothetical protein
MSNPFNQSLDQSLRGKYVEVEGSNDERYQGWLARVHHKRGSALLHSARRPATDQQLGSVFVRTCQTIAVLGPQKTIEYAPVATIHPSPYYDAEIDTVASHQRGAYRDGFTKSWPVVRPHPEREGEYELINGHRRIEACREVGCAYHPVEVVRATDEEARELVALEHPGQDQASREVESNV